MGQTSFLHLSYSREHRPCGLSAIFPRERPLGNTLIMTPPPRRSRQGRPNHSLGNHLVEAFWVLAARNSLCIRKGGLCSGSERADAPSSAGPPPMEISSERTLHSLRRIRELFLLFTSDIACSGKKQNSPTPQLLARKESFRAEGLWLGSRKHYSGRPRAPSADK